MLIGIPALAAAAIAVRMLLSDELSAWHNERLRDIAAKKTVTYIEEKYGFTPTITGTKTERSGALFDAWDIGRVIVTANDGTRDFEVYMNAETGEGADLYQLDTIEQAIQDGANAYLSGGSLAHFDFLNASGYGYFKGKFDGSNLKDLLAETRQNNLLLYYVDTDLDDSCGAYDWLLDMGLNTLLVSFDSETHMQQALDDKYNFTPQFHYAPVITNYRYVNTSQNRQIVPDVRQAGEFCYIYESAYTAGENPALIAAETDAAALIGRVQTASPNFSLGKAVSKAYALSGTPGNYSIYFPLSALDIADAQNLEVVYETEGTSGNSYRTHLSLIPYGDYLYFTLDRLGTGAFVITQNN